MDERIVESLLREHGVPALQLAVAEHGRVAPRSWGCTDATAFQTASISKPVAALAALRAGVPLDAEVNSLLRSWRLQGAPVTVRALLRVARRVAGRRSHDEQRRGCGRDRRRARGGAAWIRSTGMSGALHEI